MPQGLKIKNEADNVIFNSAQISEVDVDKERFEDDEYNQGEEETDDKDKNANNYKYDIID